MKESEKTTLSKYISLILRHKPETIGITLDEHGWADVSELLERLPCTMEVLEDIVKTDSKGRYSFNGDKTLIRANQGHSIHVDVELKECVPPEYLFHGTSEKNYEKICKTGAIKPMSRLYVHLSKDIETAVKVGRRHGSEYVIKINTKKMYNEGYKFYLSENGVWLTKEVAYEYFEE